MDLFGFNGYHDYSDEDEYDEYDEYDDYHRYDEDDDYYDEEDSYGSEDSYGENIYPRRRNNVINEHELRRSTSPRVHRTIINSPQTEILDIYRSDSEDSYDEEELLFYLDKSVKIDDDELKKKAREGNPEIAFQVGQKYSQLPNMHKAVAWYKLAAARNNAEAQLAIGNYYYNTKGDLEKAREWYTEGYNNGNTECAFQLGKTYIRINYQLTMKWYLTAFTSGIAKAALEIGHLYLHGNKPIIQSYELAMEWYLKADEGNDADAPLCIGDLYRQGRGFQTDFQAAFEWYKKAYERDNVKGAYKIGRMYLHRELAHDNTKKEALKWFYRAAINGEMDAVYQLSNLKGEGYTLGSKTQAAIIVEQDTEKTRQKYESEIETLKMQLLSKDQQIDALNNQLQMSKKASNKQNL